MDLSLLYRKIFEAVSAGGIQNIAETASLVCGQPVVITDAAFRVLGVYPKSKQNEYIWDTMLEKGYAPQEMVMCFYHEKYMEFANSNPKSTLANWGPISERPRVMAPILINGAVEGYTGMMCSNELYNSEYDEAIKVIAKAAAIEMERSRNTEIELSNNPLAKVFISNLFNNLVLTGNQLSVWQNNLGLSAAMYYRLIGIKPSDSANQGVLKYLTSLTASSFPNHISIIREDTLFILIFSSLRRSSKETLENLLKPFNVYCAVSRIFTDLLRFGAYRQQVEALLNIMPKLYPERRIFEYDNHSLEVMLSNSVKHIYYENYLAPEIKLLKEFDKNNNTDYSETLRTYLKLTENSGDTAKVLNIHRNTLLYRINKIEEIISADLKNPDVFMRLLLSFRLLEMNERLNGPNPHSSPKSQT